MRFWILDFRFAIARAAQAASPKHSVASNALSRNAKRILFVRLRRSLRWRWRVWRWFRFSRFGGCFGCFGCSSLFRLSDSCSIRETFVNRSRFDWMDLVVVPVAFRQVVLPQEKAIKPLALTQLEFLIHLDCLERADLHANLAAHANRNVDVEYFRVELRFAHVIGLFVVAFDDVNALRWTFFLANLARHTAQPCVRIVAVVNQKWKITIIFRKRRALLRILHRGQPVLLKITSDKIPGRDGHPLEYACANHRSTSPITISMLPRITITSATV